MSALTEAALLREVARVQHDKTIQAVRDLIDSIPTKDKGGYEWDQKDRTAVRYQADLVKALKAMREATDD